MKLYKKGDDSSYTLGVFPTIELLEHKPDIVKRVVVHSSIEENRGYPKIKELCALHHIPIDVHDATINKLSPKSNCYAIGVFKAFYEPLQRGNHIVLVNPMDMGNMGTIMRTMLGFGYQDLAIIRPAVDIFNPHVVRSSMGALFSLRIHYYESIDEYLKEFGDHQCYPFMLKGAKNIHQVTPVTPHSLIFGNESSGLDDIYMTYGQSVFIPHTNAIDSLNLAQSVGIGLFHFSQDAFNKQEVLR